MAYVDDLVTIRDNLVAELKGETARRAALVAQGHPPPATYTVGGRSVDWNGYLSTMREQIRQAHADAVAAGGDGGIGEEWVRAWT